MDIHEFAIFADYFVICSGTSQPMIQTLADTAINKVKKVYELVGRVEGLPKDGWMLVDFGDVVLHIFSPERRNFYRLEDLWSEAKILVHLQ